MIAGNTVNSLGLPAKAWRIAERTNACRFDIRNRRSPMRISMVSLRTCSVTSEKLGTFFRRPFGLPETPGLKRVFGWRPAIAHAITLLTGAFALLAFFSRVVVIRRHGACLRHSCWLAAQQP